MKRTYLQKSAKVNEIPASELHTTFKKTIYFRMKILLLLTFFFLCTTVSATDYYISASGNDANTGLTISTPWKTITKVNSAFANMKPGDQILFNRGDTFYGSLVISKSGTSGSPITIGAYGAGEKPIITGFTTVTAWTNLGNNIWESANAVSPLSTCNMVVINGLNTPMGRYPKTSFLTYQSHSGNTTITSSSLTGNPNWTGAEIVIKKERWALETGIITSQSGSTLTYTDGSLYTPTDGFGFFIQNDIKTLTSQNEWYYNSSTRKLLIYSTSSPTNVQVATIDYLISGNARSYLTVDNITLQGVNSSAISISSSNYITITNCQILYAGVDGIIMPTISTYFAARNNTIQYCNNHGITCGNGTNTTIEHNTLSKVGIIEGVTQTYNLGSITIGNANNSLVQYNKIDSSGYHGIFFTGTNTILKNNFINNSLLIKDDGGGIYTSGAGVGREINGNVIINTIGKTAGTNATNDNASHGIYTDTYCDHVTIINNSIASSGGSGIFISGSHDYTINNNTVYNCGNTGFSKSQIELNFLGYSTVRNLAMNNNIFFAKETYQLCFFYYSQANSADIKLYGSGNNNYWARPTNDNLVFMIQSPDNPYPGTYYNLAAWRTFTGNDANSNKAPIAITNANNIQFIYNELINNKIITLPSPMIDVKGVKFAGSIVLLPFTSAVLMVDPNPDLPTDPMYIKSSVRNTTPSLIEMTYDLSLANIVPATSAFTVLVNAAARAVNAVAISGTNVHLTLASAIAFGDVVTVAYTKPALNPLQTSSAGQAASVTAQAVTNNISAPVPLYISAAVGNTAPSLVEMNYNLSLANIVPATSAFSVLVNAAVRAVSAVAISGTKVQLILASAIAYGDVVTVSYTKPALNPLQTSSAGQAASVTAQTVTNSINPPVPVYVSAAVGNTTPSLIEMTYDLSLGNIVPATSAFSVLVNSAAKAVNTVAISGTKVQLTLASAIAFGDVVTVAYTKPAVSPLQTTSAGLAASVSAQAVTNSINPPVPLYVSSAVGNANPSRIEMTYNLSLANIVPATSAFTILVNSAARAVNAVAISGTKVQLTLASAIAFGDVVTVAYTKPAVSPLQTASAGLAASVTAQAVTNSINPPVPVYVSSAVGNTTPSLVEMTNNLILANIVPATSAFTVLVNSAARTVNAVAISGTKVQLTLASAIAFGDVVTIAYTKPAVSPLQTSSAGQAASVSAQAVTNNISAPVPVYASAAVGNPAPSLIEMTYNLSLANIVPATSAFTVLVNSAARAVSAVAVSGTKVQLTLASAIAFGDVVTVAYTKPAVSPLQTSSAGQAASIIAQAVTNNINAPVPVYVSAIVGNTAPSLIEMTYDLSLANIVPATSAFTVLVNSAARTVSAVAISGTKVQLTLASAIAFGDVVTVAYTKPSASPLQTASAGMAASVAAQAVTNNVSAPVPLYVSAAVGNATPPLLEMTYNLSLANIVPGTSAFTVLVNSAARAVNSVVISGTKVQLTLASAIAFGDVVTVAYTKPAVSPLQTISAGQAASITAQAVTNNISAPVPVYVSAAVGNTAPSLIEMTYDLSLANIVPATSAFTVLVNAAARAVSAVAISGTKVQLTLASAIAFGDVVTVAYTKPAVSPLQTSSAGLAASVTAQAVTNNISAPVPVYASAAVGNTAPSLVEMTYDLSLDNIVPASSAFTVLVNSAARTVNAVAVSGTKVQLTLASAIAFGDVVTVAYTKPTVSPLQTSSAGQAASITAQTVTNNISAPVPVYVSAAVGNATPSLVEMTYNLSLANIVPATSAFSVLVNSAARAVNAVAIAGTKVQLTLASAIAFGDVVTVAYTKPPVRPLQTASAGQAASVTAQAVANSTNPTGINGSHFVPVWQGENGTNHMNLIVVSATLESLPLSVNDEIAVFSGSRCVGSMILTESINPALNSTFLAIPASQDDGSNNGFINNDSIIFKIWDHTNQREMGITVVKYKNDLPTWLTSGKYSSEATSVVEIATFTENTQTITLLQGYNLISTNISPENPNVSTVTKQLMDQGELIKVQDEAGNSFENWGSFGGWTNKLGSFETTEGYKIKVANNCTLRVTGRPIVLPLDIPLKSGWNIISFPRTDLVDAMDIIQSLIDQNKLIKVQDEAGNSIENWGIFGGWKNAIGNFTPGKAYKVKSNADAVISIHENYLKSAAIPVTAAKAEYFLTKIEGNGTDHMNINIVGLQESGLSIGDELAAFDGDVCVGSLKITKNHMIDGTAGLVASASSNTQKPDGFKEGSTIRIVGWNKLTNKEFQVQAELLNGQLNYQKEASVLIRMKTLTPDAKIIDDGIKTQVYPNPCNGKFTVRLSALPEAGGRIEILDISGRNILSRGILETAEQFNLDHQQPGIYIVKTIIGSSQTNHKLIIY